VACAAPVLSVVTCNGTRCGSNCPLLFVAGEATTAADNLTELPSDTAVSEFCTVVSSVGSSEMDGSSSSQDQLSATAHVTVTVPTVTDSTVITDSQPTVAASFRNKVQDSVTVDSTNVWGLRQRHVAPSTLVDHSVTSQNTTVSGNSFVLGNATASANPTGSAAQTVSVQEYCQAFEQWMWQYYWWMQHVHWMTWAAHMSAPMYTTAPCIPTAGTQPPVTSAIPAARPVGLQHQPAQQQQQPQPRGYLACRFMQFAVFLVFSLS